MQSKFNSLREAAARGYLKAGVAFSVATMAVPSMAQTAGPDPFDTAIDAVKLKVAAYAEELVVLAAIAVVFMIAIKYVKKIPRAA